MLTKAEGEFWDKVLSQTIMCIVVQLLLLIFYFHILILKIYILQEQELEEGEFNKQQFQEFEDAFARMKKAAGVSEIDEVINRFSTQNKTASILEGQMRLAETDVRTLGEMKESLQKEWEQVRYLGQDEDIKIR